MILSVIVITQCLETTKPSRPITRVANSHFRTTLLTDFGSGAANFPFNHRRSPLGDLGRRSTDAPVWLIWFFDHFNCFVCPNVHNRSLGEEMELSQPSQPVTPTMVALGGTSVSIVELEEGRRLGIKDTPWISGRDTLRGLFGFGVCGYWFPRVSSYQGARGIYIYHRLSKTSAAAISWVMKRRITWRQAVGALQYMMFSTIWIHFYPIMVYLLM